MKRLQEALETLGLSVDILEESAAAALASAQPSKQTSPTKSAPKTKARGHASAKAAKSDDVAQNLFTPNELSTVKRRLDDAIERLESALEVTADGAR